MVDPKVFMKGFLEYLTEYYGLGNTQRQSTHVLNNMNVPLFSKKKDAAKEIEQMEQMMPPQEPEMELPMQNLGGLSMTPPDDAALAALNPQVKPLNANELNGMFPGPYSRGM